MRISERLNSDGVKAREPGERAQDMADTLHYIKMNGMDSLVACSIYWSIGLTCPWCGQEPPPGYFESVSTTTERRRSADSGKG